MDSSNIYSGGHYAESAKTYGVASIQRDTLRAGIVLSIGRLRRVQEHADRLPWAAAEELRRALGELTSALDESELVR
jgi:hypothetical protein